jgi:hypothetical protein
MFGLLCYAGVTMNYGYFFFFPLGLVLLYFFLLKETTPWYRHQFLKYTTLGMFLILLTLVTHIDLRFFEFGMTLKELSSYFGVVIKRKAFFSLSLIGFLALLLILFRPKLKVFSSLTIDFSRMKELSFLVFCLLLTGIFLEKDLIRSFGILWFVVFLSVLPLELIFQSISRLRSRRNFIYGIYVLVCLLDSHFEGRLRILYTFYQSPPDIVEYLNR